MAKELGIEASGAPVVLSVWSGESGAPPVVFLPGTMTHPLFYEEFLDGVNVVRVHLQGHGKSPRVRRPFSFEDLRQNAFDAVGYASECFGEKVLVLGSSQGGVPLALTSYPLHFLASLFSADMSFLEDGSIRCPVVVIASTGYELFPLDYVRRIYGRIVAPHKEMLVFDLDRHLIFNECVEVVLQSVAAKLGEYA